MELFKDEKLFVTTFSVPTTSSERFSSWLPNDHRNIFKNSILAVLAEEFCSVQQLNDNWMRFINSLLFFSFSQRFPFWTKNERKSWWKCYQNSSVQAALSLTLNKIILAAQHFRSLFSLGSHVIENVQILQWKHKIQIVADLLFVSLIKNDNSICASNWVSGKIYLHIKFYDHYIEFHDKTKSSSPRQKQRFDLHQ